MYICNYYEPRKRGRQPEERPPVKTLPAAQQVRDTQRARAHTNRRNPSPYCQNRRRATTARNRPPLISGGDKATTAAHTIRRGRFSEPDTANRTT